MPATAQSLQSISSDQKSATTAQKQRIQTEIVAVTRAGASPSHITRKPGVFFLELVSEAPDAQLNFTIVPAVALPDASKLQGILDLAGLRRKRGSAGLVDLVPGQYYLQTVPDNKTICTITIQGVN